MAIILKLLYNFMINFSISQIHFPLITRNNFGYFKFTASFNKSRIQSSMKNIIYYYIKILTSNLLHHLHFLLNSIILHMRVLKQTIESFYKKINIQNFLNKTAMAFNCNARKRSLTIGECGFENFNNTIQFQKLQNELNECLQINLAKQLDEQESLINFNSLSLLSQAQCGYCNGVKSKKWVTSGFSSMQMNFKCYAMMLDRGWRRSGNYYYKACQQQSCCLAFPIRIDVNKYIQRSLQTKVLKRIKKIEPIREEGLLPILEISRDEKSVDLLELQEFLKNMETNYQMPDKIYEGLEQIKINNSSKYLHIRNIQLEEEKEIILKQLRKYVSVLIDQMKCNLDKIINVLLIGFQEFSEQIIYNISELAYNLIKKAEEYYNIYEKLGCRASRKISTILSKNIFPFGCNLIAYFLEDFRNQMAIQFHFKMLSYIQNKEWKKFINNLLEEVRLIFNEEFQFEYDPSGQLYLNNNASQQYKMKKIMVYKFLLEKDQNVSFQKIQQKFNNFTFKKNINNNLNNNIEIKWVKAQYEEDSFQLYTRYLKEIHHNQRISKQNYVNFLCHNSFTNKLIKSLNSQGKALECGCWHMKYYLQTELIAVGVVDIMPTSLSQVYYFYEPNYKKYSLGVYGVLKEIEYIKQMQQEGHPLFQYYYMGYYIQDSKKLAYKGEYQQSELLCPKTYQWVTLDQKLRESIQLMQKDNNIEISLSQKQAILEDMNLENINEIEFVKENAKFLIQNKIYKSTDLNRKYRDLYITQFAKLLPIIGKKLLSEFLFISK